MQRTAIVVDDIAFARNMIKEILIAARYNVVAEASNGDEAVRLYNQYKPDFVTMDVVMPIKGGIEATRRILEEHKDARVIIISAMAHEHLLMDAINAGARDYILKPFTSDELLKAVEKVLVDYENPTQIKGAEHGSI